MATKQQKTVTTLFRVEIKGNHDVIYRVRNGSDHEYLVTINANGTTACIQCENDQPCPSTKTAGRKCYHIKECLKMEEARVIVSYNDVDAEGVSVDHAYEKVQRYVKAADLGMSVVEYLQSLRAPEVVPIVSPELPVSDSNLSAECPVPAEIVPSEELPELPAQEEGEIDTTPLTEEETALFEHVEDGEIVLADEIKVEEEWKEPTRAQVIASIRRGVNQLVDDDPDYASASNNKGPNGSDTEFMHRFANKMADESKPILISQWLKASQKLQRYKNTQLQGMVLPMAVVEKALGAPSVESNLAARGFMR